MLYRFSAWAGSNQIWIAIIGAALVKVVLSESQGLWSALSTFFIAVFFGWLLTAFNVFGVSENMLGVVGAVSALVSQQIAKVAILLASDHETMKQILLRRFGGKK